MCSRSGQCRAGIDYHVEVIDKHYYSVPYTLVRQELWASYTASTVEVFHLGKRIAVHRRGPPNRGHTTLPEHMPSSYRRYADWTLERIMREAAEIGPNTAALIEIILREQADPEQGFRLLSRHREARGTLSSRAGGSGLRASARHRHPLLHLCQIHPRHQARSANGRESRGRTGDRSRQHPRPHLLPLRRHSDVQPSHPRPAQRR